MNDTTIEAIAREYCRRVGANPDEMIWGSDRQHPTLARQYPRWEFHVDDVRAAIAMRDAIHSVTFGAPGSVTT